MAFARNTLDKGGPGAKLEKSHTQQTQGVKGLLQPNLSRCRGRCGCISLTGGSGCRTPTAGFAGGRIVFRAA